MAQLNKLLADKNWKELVSNGEIALNRSPDNIDIYKASYRLQTFK